MWYAPLLLADHKNTPKWAWPGSRDPISEFRHWYEFDQITRF